MPNHKWLDLSLITVGEVERFILQRIAQEHPFSLVRVGDGEGHLLGLSESYEKDEIDYFADHFGEVDVSFLREMQRDLKTAVLEADMVGIRDDMVGLSFGDAPFSMELLRSRMTLRESERNIKPASARRLFNTVNALAQLRFPEKQLYCSAWIHFRLQMSGFFERLLATQSRLAVITSKKKVGELLRSAFGLDVILWSIPNMFKYVTEPEQYDIEEFRRVNREIANLSHGCLFLIAGGLWGKIFAQTIKTNRGYALDVGSLIDYWVGEATRPLVMADLIGDSAIRGRVPPQMQLQREGGLSSSMP